MRKSTSRVKPRLITAAVATCALSAAMLAVSQAAFAVAFATQNPYAGPPGTVVTVTSSNLWTTTTPAALLVPTSVAGTSTCPATYAAPTAPAVAATVAKVDNNTLNITVPTTITLGANNAPKQYSLCTYGSTTTALVNEGFFTVTPATAVSPATGASGGGNSITLTSTGTVLPSTLGATFVPKGTACAAKYTVTPGSGIQNGTATKTSDTVASVIVPVGVAGAGTTATPWTVCLYGGTTAGTSDIIATSGAAFYSVTLPGVSLNTSVGAGGTATPPPTLVVSSPNNFLTGVTAPQALFTTAACPAVYASTATFINPVLKSANNRGAVTVPAGAVIGAGPVYNVCVYNGSTAGTSRLLASAVYTVATPPSVGGVLPGGGSSLGGDLITVTGTNFPTTPGSIQATLGGVPLNNINPIDANTFTATSPPHAAEAGVPVVVTTATGSSTLAGAFNYVNGIAIAPNTASNANDGVWVDVKGVGFESLTFDTAAFATNNAKARVFLIDAKGACTTGPNACAGTAAYIPADADAGALAECKTPAVISGSELFCKLDLHSGALDPTTSLTATNPIVPNGTYTLTVVANGDTTAVAPAQSVISSGSTFTVADF